MRASPLGFGMNPVRPRLNAGIRPARLLAAATLAAAAILPLHPGAADAADQPNIVFILVDDQRYDELGFINPLLDTPNLDALAERGVFFENAVVTTSLCSPSRATILTGQYMHNHGVVDNNTPLRPGTTTFPELLQAAGYRTALVGKWHMGGLSDEPRPGFDHWVSFAGQGTYRPTDRFGNVAMFNVNGERIPQRGYITDELTDYAIEWLDAARDAGPWLLYLSHKAVHSNFTPAERHRDQYSDITLELPASATLDKDNPGRPLWVRNQRNSFHGIEFPYHDPDTDLLAIQRNYHRTMSAVDDSVGRILGWLDERGETDNTVVIYTSDNGFYFGEHGLIDKRSAYEESMRVPMIVTASGRLPQGKTVSAQVANLDIAPTILDLAGAQIPEQFDGQSFRGLAEGSMDPADWRDETLYEYFWEFNFPHTPTTFAIRTNDFKLIQYHGIWDTDELYDMRADPLEMNNLIADRNYLDTVVDLRRRLHVLLADNEGRNVVPYSFKYNQGAVFRNGEASPTATHPPNWLKEGTEADLLDFKITDEEKLQVTDEAELARLRSLR